MGKSKKSKAERRIAASKHAQRTGTQITNKDRAITSEVKLAADFIISCDKRKNDAKKETGLSVSTIHKIATGNKQPKPHEVTIITEVASKLGWEAPSA